MIPETIVPVVPNPTVAPTPITMSSKNVDTPATFNCFANKVLPVTVVIPAKVATPAWTLIPPVLTRIPCRAVIIPTESIFVTSSYVNVPPIDTSCLKVATPVTNKSLLM